MHLNQTYRDWLAKALETTGGVGFQLNGYAIARNPKSCGLWDVSYPIIGNFDQDQPDKRRMYAAWFLSKWPYVKQESGGLLAGLMIYTYSPNTPTRVYTEVAKILLEFGFTDILAVPNPSHDYREMRLLVCHTEPCTEAIAEGRKGTEWVDSSVTKAAQNAVQEIM